MEKALIIYGSFPDERQFIRIGLAEAKKAFHGTTKRLIVRDVIRRDWLEGRIIVVSTRTHCSIGSSGCAEVDLEVTCGKRA